jgi:gamma-glutamylcyclotransferase (GGCT)/AIG2-like uncharacterized protein YtfP
VLLPDSSVPLFVYGSLRPGGELWPDISDHVITSHRATVAGRLHWHAGGEWPVLLPAASDTDRVHGELLSLRPGVEVNRIIVDEEIRYGYDVRWMPARTADGELESLVFVWNRTEDVGNRIVSGDYADVMRDS